MENAKTPKEWVSIVDERIKQAEDWENRRNILRQLNYYLGNQFIVWDSSSKKMTTAPQEPGVERIVHNIIKPKVMVKVAKQIKNKLKYEVMPDTTEQRRIEIAELANRALDHWWKEQEMGRKSRDIFLQNGIKGWCALKVFFDNTRGEDITPEGEVEEQLFTGEIVAYVVDPLSLYIDPAATNDDEIRWVIEQKPRDIDYIKETYGVDVPEDENVEYANNDLTISSGYSNMQKSKRNYKMAMVSEMWVKPCKKYPNGLKVTTANNTLLDVDENAGEIPYTIFVDIPIPSSVKGDAFIKDMLPIQRHINITKSMIATHAKRMGNAIWTVPIGSDFDEDELTNEIGGVVHYPGTGPAPQRIGPPDLPSIYDRLIEFYMRDIDDMSGAREISQGNLPTGLDTYSGLQLMVEQENEKLSISSENYERGMKRALKRVLHLMRNHYTEERLIKIVGQDGQLEVESFLGSDLSGGEDIDIVQGSSLPELKTSQQERIMTLWNMGAIVDRNGQPDHETFLRLLGMGDAEAVYEEKELDENKAKFENKTIIENNNPQMLQLLQQYQANIQQYGATQQQVVMQGGDPNSIPPPQSPISLQVRDFHDHETHIYYHNLFRKSAEYDKLPPELQQVIDNHVNEHVQALQAPMMAQQQAQQQQMQEQQQAQADQQAQLHAADQQNQAENIALQHRKLDLEEKKLASQHQIGMSKAQK